MTQRRRVADHPSRASPGSCLERSLPVRGSRTSTRARIQPFLRYGAGIAGYRFTFETGATPRPAPPSAGACPAGRSRAVAPARRRAAGRARGGSHHARVPGPACGTRTSTKEYNRDTGYCSIHGWFTINDLYAAFVCNRPNARSLPFLVRLRAHRAVGPLRRGWIPSCTCAARAPPSRLADQPPTAAQPHPHSHTFNDRTGSRQRFHAFQSLVLCPLRARHIRGACVGVVVPVVVHRLCVRTNRLRNMQRARLVHIHASVAESPVEKSPDPGAVTTKAADS